MAEHSFGGSWTEEKLECLESYLIEYMKIFTRNEKARHFTTWYVDAFAGTGGRSSAATPLFDDLYDEPESKSYREGSVQKALRLTDPFDRYFFIEKSKAHVDELNTLVERHHAALFPTCEFEHGDANALLREWCAKRDWKQERAVVFLDPYGMQVNWSTVEMLAATKGIDLWYLFPLGTGVMRLLTRSGNIPVAWKKRLTVLFGTPDWESRFFRTIEQEGLFGTMEERRRDASVENIQSFTEERLQTCFLATAKGLVLRNSRDFPLYLLCFAAANERGADAGIRIAQYILNARPGKRSKASWQP